MMLGRRRTATTAVPLPRCSWRRAKGQGFAREAHNGCMFCLLRMWIMLSCQRVIIYLRTLIICLGICMYVFIYIYMCIHTYIIITLHIQIWLDMYLVLTIFFRKCCQGILDWPCVGEKPLRWEVLPGTGQLRLQAGGTVCRSTVVDHRTDRNWWVIPSP